MSRRSSRLLPVVLLSAATCIAAAIWSQRTSEPVDGAAPGPDVADVAGVPGGRAAPQPAALQDWPDFLPQEARPVLQRIASDGPHPYRQDGSVFQNREGRLPQQPAGYYREYTVDTPGLGHRGARRIVTGGRPPAVYYYTQDHYDSFRRFDPPRGRAP